MKYKFLFLFLCFVFSSFGQNWLPIDTAKDYNFTIGDGELIMRTISTEKSNDTIFFETVLDSCYSCSYSSYPDTFLLKQPDFLGFYMLNSFDTSYSFYGRDTFTIKTNASLGASWAYGSGRTATVIGEGVQSFDAQVDSIKTIWLGGGDTLVLAKEHGLVRFPCLWRNKLYQQIGIEEIYGAQDLSFWNVYNYEIGDVFQYRNSYGDADNNPSGVTYFLRIEILNKEINSNGFSYYAHFKGKHSYYQSSIGGTHLVNNISDYFDTLNIVYDDTILSKKTGTWFELPPGSGVSNIHLSSFYEYDDWGNLTKSYDIPPSLGVFVNIGGYFVCPSFCYLVDFERRMEYKIGLGKTFDEGSFFESGFRDELIGYNKGAGIIGTVYPDEFYVGINDSPKINEMIRFYPNPIQDNLWIEVLYKDELQIELRNVYGQIIWSREIEESAQLDLSNHPKGIYFLQACTPGYPCASAKLIKN
ncbi:MAG: T9SS type A sorting domain-containing protein [Chitinophagales bacterium]